MRVSTSLRNRNASLSAVLFALLLALQNVFAQGAQDPFIGTWHIKVPTSDQGFPPFEAIHTFHAGGTMSEVSSNFATLTESSAFGVWARNGSGYDMTFQLFIFDSTGAHVGRVQVRTFITLVGEDSLVAQTAVDVIEPNGNLIPGVDGGPFYGKRIKPTPVTAVQERSNERPVSFQLEQNYPNPFNPTTTIRYQLQKSAQVSLKVYDAMGREVRSLVDEKIPSGAHAVNWDGKDNSRRAVSSGLYFYKLRADQVEAAKRMLLVK